MSRDNRPTIVIVNDDQDFLEIAAGVLRDAGYDVTTCDKARECYRVIRDARPLMAAEDFAFMLQASPGAYAWIGNGTGEAGGCMVHNPGYDFNDAILATGAAYWVSLARTCLPVRTP